MKLVYFRIPDIVKRTGIPEETVREYADLYDEFLTWGDDGRERLYTPDVLYIIGIIHGMDTEGTSPDDIRAELDRRFPQIREDRCREEKTTTCPTD
jgi:DNA-binding transcriptional MerR regulator